MLWHRVMAALTIHNVLVNSVNPVHSRGPWPQSSKVLQQHMHLHTIAFAITHPPSCGPSPLLPQMS